MENFEDKLNAITKLLSKRLNHSQIDLLFNYLKEIQENRVLSIEFIRWILLSNQIKRADRHIYKTGKKVKEIEKIIKKFYNLLNKRGIKLNSQVMTYKRWEHSVDTFKRPMQRLITTFRL